MTEHRDRFEYCYACLGSVEFRTNGPQGGDGGHGGYLEITFDTENGSTALEVEVNGREPQSVDKLVLRFLGDSEMEAARDAFAFLSSKIKPVI
ncbi:hypothetical protein [Amorphus orientalis]|uniref:Uncharacterized protein n=1 Tax=Amorphus orientalis TaxID=649198 RepID=A0AAE4ASB7_9HYPH|nr:hypothetical protein [Amorphus orientalis]MDQ0315073.1 hypothetical protein [Amorphus orientalis]